MRAWLLKCSSRAWAARQRSRGDGEGVRQGGCGEAESVLERVEGVGEVGHRRLALVHRAHDAQVGHDGVAHLALGEGARDDADGLAAARHHGISMRIGVNAGSLEKDIQKKYTEPTGEALLESAMRHIDILDRLNFHEFKVSVKASNVFLTLDAYRLLSAQIDNPLHLGVTEAGVCRKCACRCLQPSSSSSTRTIAWPKCRNRLRNGPRL